MDKQIQEKFLQVGEEAFQMMVEKELYTSIISAVIVFLFMGLFAWCINYSVKEFKASESYNKDGFLICGVCAGAALLLSIAIFSSLVFSALYPEATVLHDVFGKASR